MEQAAKAPAITLPATRRRLTILGATGSIGSSTLDLVLRNRDSFDIEAVTAATNVAGLADIARKTGAQLAVIADQTRYGALVEALSGSGIEAAAGEAALVEAAARPADLVMAAIVGAAGLAPTLSAIRAGTDIALANKECLVCAGDLVMAEARAHGSAILPVDSEHNAIFQVLDADRDSTIERITLTASGGPFREKSLEEMARATPEQALNHPNWSMGPKISVDSATMINKGLELIEAHHLFGVGPDRLDVLVHPQSIVHSLVSFADGSVLAQLGAPDMRTPISYTLAWPRRMATPSPRLDLSEIGTLSFEAVDHERFPAVALALSCLEAGGGAATVLNGANEVAVAWFLDGRIGFRDIVAVADAVLNQTARELKYNAPKRFEDVVELDRLARESAGREAARMARD